MAFGTNLSTAQIDQVAGVGGFAKVSVARVIKGDPTIRESVTRRVRAVLKELGFEHARAVDIKEGTATDGAPQG